MSEAMRLIVDGYVRLGFSNALEDLLNHRRAMARQLQFRSIASEFNLEALTTTIGNEIALIEEGIERIKNPGRTASNAETVDVADRPVAQPALVQQIVEIGAQRDETAGSLIDTVIGLLKKQPHEPQSVDVQRDIAVITETAALADPVSPDEPPIFREHSMGGQFTYRWGSRPRDSDSGEA
jgi:hypothetical protein